MIVKSAKVCYKLDSALSILSLLSSPPSTSPALPHLLFQLPFSRFYSTFFETFSAKNCEKESNDKHKVL